MRRLLALLRRVGDELEDAILSWLYSSALERHKPVMIDDPSGVVDHLGQELVFHHPWCMACVKHWPCPRWEEVQKLAAKQRADRS